MSSKRGLPHLTKGRSCNHEWNKNRKGVITATKLPPLIRKYDDELEVRNNESAKSLVADILHYKTPVSTKGMRWGIVNEPIVNPFYQYFLLVISRQNFSKTDL